MKLAPYYQKRRFGERILHHGKQTVPSAKKSCSAELVDRSNVSDTLAVFKFLLSDPLSFKAGQYATLGIESDGEVLERPYSIVSAPNQPFLEFFVELLVGGVFTPKLFELKVGSKLRIRRRVVGRFTMSDTCKKHLMLATVTGIAPFVSIARTLQFKQQNRSSAADQLLIIHGASSSRDLGPYREELESLTKTGWLNYVPTVSRPWDEPLWKGETGRVEDVLRKHADRLGFVSGNTTAYACGHPGMIENVKGILTRNRFLQSHIKTEDFFSSQSLKTPQELRKLA
jgi:ferredoxin--NADP+ reductase